MFFKYHYILTTSLRYVQYFNVVFVVLLLLPFPFLSVFMVHFHNSFSASWSTHMHCVGFALILYKKINKRQTKRIL